MADNWIESFAVALGFDVNTASLNAAKRSISDYKQAVVNAEKEIEDARWAAAKSDEERAKLQREATLKEARAALAAAEQKEKAEKEQGKKREERHAAFIAGMSKVALAATAMATAVGFAVNKVTGAFDNLAFTSARTGASVQSLKSIGYAFSQVGGSSQQAIGAVEKFAAALRQNDGLKSYVASLGVDTTKDMADQLLDTVDVLSKHPYQVGSREAGMLGISEEDYKLLTQYAAKVKEYRAEYDATTKALGVNSGQAAEAAQSFQRTLTRLQATTSTLSDKLMVSLAPALEAILKRFQDWIAANPERVEQILRNVSDAIVWVADKIRAIVEWFASDNGNRFMERWDSFNERIKAIGTAFETVWGVLKKIDEWLHLSTLYGFIDKLGTLILSGRFGLGGAIQDALGVGQGSESTASPLNGSDGAARDRRKWYEKILPKALGGKDGPIPGGTARVGREAQSANAQTIIGELRKAGYNDNAIAAVVGSMQTESGLNPAVPENSYNHGHHGLWQWDSQRWPKIKKWIEGQGGDPYSAAWQTRAWVAEHNAKPGDAIYDTGRTQRGGAILRSNPSIDDAIHGVRESERFGVGEEGGRAAKARGWLPHVAASTAPAPSPSSSPSSSQPQSQSPSLPASPPTDPSPAPATSPPAAQPAPQQNGAAKSPAPAEKMRGLPNMTPGGFDPNNINPSNLMPAAPVGASPVTNNSTTSSSRSLTQHNSFKVDITGSQTPREHADAFTKQADGLYALALRNAQTATV